VARKTSRSSSTRRVIRNTSRRLPKKIIIPNLIRYSQEDLRRYHPMGRRRPLTTFSGRRFLFRHVIGNLRRSLKSRSRSKHSIYSPFHVRIFAPPDAVICAKRNVRREVIFARGKGGGGHKRKPRYTEYSNISCRR
jgi:hypothetical protein